MPILDNARGSIAHVALCLPRDEIRRDPAFVQRLLRLPPLTARVTVIAHASTRDFLESSARTSGRGILEVICLPDELPLSLWLQDRIVVAQEHTGQPVLVSNAIDRPAEHARRAFGPRDFAASRL